MKRYGLIGYPIADSGSPALFEKAYGGRFGYDLLEDSCFDRAWERFLDGYDGVNVTSPFKMLAAERADVRSEVVERAGCANICVKRDGLVHAFNSDYLAVKALLERYAPGMRTAAVLGLGGAGRAALAAAADLGFEVRGFHHSDLSEGVCTDVVISTLVQSCDGVGAVKAKTMIEANYHNPVFSGRGDCVYAGGLEWLSLQARLGYALLTGEEPEGLGRVRDIVYDLSQHNF